MAQRILTMTRMARLAAYMSLLVFSAYALVGENVCGSTTSSPIDASKDAERRSHWSFQPVRRPDVPAVTRSAWARSDIDRFVLSRLEREHLSPSAEVSRVGWLRRTYFTLIG